jgi:hypothetical protein
MAKSKRHNPRNGAGASSYEKGSDFERDLQKVYESMLKQELADAKVERRLNLIDSSGRLHEIDLYWTFTLAGVQHKVVVQAKDWATKIPLGELIKFHKILELLPGQPRGLFITRTGFQKGAFDYANDHGIGLLTFRKPSDYQPGKKPEGIIFATITAERIEYVYRSALHFDLDAINKEKQRPVAREELEQATGLLKDNIALENNLAFYDEEGRVVANFQDSLHILYPELARNPQLEDLTGRTFEFAAPTFVLTRQSNIPRLKVDAITIARVGERVTDRLEVTADSVVKGILEDLITGQVQVFNNEFKAGGPITIPFEVSDNGRFFLS